MEHEDKIVLKTIAIRRGMLPGYVWLERISGPRQDEGGDFDMDAIDALLSKFYDENF